MTAKLQELGPWQRWLFCYSILVSSCVLDAKAMVLRGREWQNRRALPASTVSSVIQATTPASAISGQGIPLWHQCDLSHNEMCAGEAQCICKNMWWSQCRVPLNGSWTPLGEAWQCSEPKPNGTAPSNSPLAVFRSQTLRPSAQDTRLAPIHTSETGSRAVATTNEPTPSTYSSVSQFANQSRSASIVLSSTMSLPVSMSSSEAFPTRSVPPRPTTESHFLGTKHFTKPTSQIVHGPALNRSSMLVSSSGLVAGSASSSTSFASLNSSSLSSIHASAYAHPFIISVSAHLSSSSMSISASATALASPSVTFANEISQPSRTTMLPNLACPLPSAAEDASEPRFTGSASRLACDPNMPMTSGGVSKLTNTSSSTPVSSPNPDAGGVYMASNATADQKNHCLNIAAHQYQMCWEVLNMAGYLNDWIIFNEEKCNYEGMGFADCFLYIEVGGGANCTAFTGRSQCSSPDARTYVGRKNGAQAYYVAFNIWNIQNWFFTYYMAVGGANSLAAESVNTIARTLNLPLPKPFPVVDLLAGLAFAFGLLSPSGYAAALPVLGQRFEGFAAQAPGEYLLRALQNTPTLSRNMLDKGSLSETDVQIAELSSDLARIVSQLQTNIQNSIVLIMSNSTVFFDFVQDGFFSTQIENLNTLAQNVTLSLNTYIVSQALQDDDVIITRALDTDINELQLNGSALHYDTGCGGNGYDEWGMCGSWWYDSANRISYGLESMKDMLNNYTDALESLFNQGLTTPELLFMNSQFCADASGSSQGNAPGTSLTTTSTTGAGMWNTECISNMKICTWDTVNLDVYREFTDCEREPSFAMAGCGAGLEIVQAVMPASYIGPYLTSPLYQGVSCNYYSRSMGNPG